MCTDNPAHPTENAIAAKLCFAVSMDAAAEEADVTSKIPQMRQEMKSGRNAARRMK